MLCDGFVRMKASQHTIIESQKPDSLRHPRSEEILKSQDLCRNALRRMLLDANFFTAFVSRLSVDFVDMIHDAIVNCTVTVNVDRKYIQVKVHQKPMDFCIVVNMIPQIFNQATVIVSMIRTPISYRVGSEFLICIIP